MAYDFKRLSDVESLTEVPEGATVLAEVNGSIKRIPGEGLGGGGVNTAIIKDSMYDNTLAGVQAAVSDGSELVTYECINMTFEEAYETMATGEPLSCILMCATEGCMNVPGVSMFAGIMIGVPCIMLMFTVGTDPLAMLYWTADGLSTELPSSGK